jgi:hypothetical protein
MFGMRQDRYSLMSAPWLTYGRMRLNLLDISGIPGETDFLDCCVISATGDSHDA